MAASMLIILNALSVIVRLLPNLIRLITHYGQIIEAGEISDHDKAEGKAILEGLRWKSATEIEEEHRL